ncbi:DUF4191 domain-containing protein [Litorihabitans aurantiacus]|uniref:DUF4191 domain-containing protein n=1 Tax=Litorihabitans aurantiacus TaxID=1930061 RepID=A0AA37XE55_9MICO|nr:DUF4191 domain-containing protein [Litorihabitans aurantiacus]GMA31506.1 hypothetical protein GCM10025875_14980 [Litorihabitans aurantiacus]
MARSSSGSAEPTKPKKSKVRKRRWYHQVWDVFQMTRKADPTVPWIMLAILVIAAGLGFAVGAIFNQGPYGLFVGVPVGILAATIFLSRRAERAAYSSLEGQPGAVSAALGTIRRGWNIEEQPVAVDGRSQAMVFRAIGRPGVVFVADGGSRGIQQRLLEGERKRAGRLVPDVPIHLMQTGREEGQVPLPKVAAAVKKHKNRLTPAEVAEITKRLKALGGVRMPIPKGVDPTRMRPDRKGMRGR